MSQGGIDIPSSFTDYSGYMQVNCSFNVDPVLNGTVHVEVRADITGRSLNYFYWDDITLVKYKGNITLDEQEDCSVPYSWTANVFQLRGSPELNGTMALCVYENIALRRLANTDPELIIYDIPGKVWSINALYILIGYVSLTCNTVFLEFCLRNCILIEFTHPLRPHAGANQSLRPSVRSYDL